MSQATAAPEGGIVKKVALSSFLGNFIEWFDYGSPLSCAEAVKHRCPKP